MGASSLSDSQAAPPNQSHWNSEGLASTMDIVWSLNECNVQPRLGDCSEPTMHVMAIQMNKSDRVEADCFYDLVLSKHMSMFS